MAKDSRLPSTDRKTGDAVQGEPLVQDNTPGEVSSLVGHADNADDGIRLSERPKLNLKPRSRPGESAAEDRSEKHRYQFETDLVYKRLVWCLLYQHGLLCFLNY